MKTHKKRKKLKIKRLLLVLFVLFAIPFLCVKIASIPIKSIIIKNNEILTDYEIIKEARLEDYPSFVKSFTFTIKNRLMKNKYINDVKVRKGLFTITIDIKENKVLYIDSRTDEKVMINSKVKDNKKLCVPYLLNEVPSSKQEDFLNGMNKIDKDMLCLISEIKFDPNEIDKDRFFLYMNDGNIVYLTINKFEKINKYNKILENVGKQNGVLYLDYGDYFEVK